VTTLFELLTSLNPWWTGQEFETGKPRVTYFSKIRRYLETDEIIVLSGVRRSGKTTLLFQTIKYLVDEKNIPPRNILFVNCDEPEISSLENSLSKVIDTYRKEVPAKGPLYLVFDEIQSIEGWERTIKSLYDRKKFKIIISGSSSYLLDSQISTLLSGRYFSIPVFPLNFVEYLSFQGIETPKDQVSQAAKKYEILTQLKRYLREGGFPIVVLQEDELTKNDYLKAYYDSIVYRDIIRVNEIRNQKALAELLHYLFTNVTAPYSYRRLKELLGIDLDTVQDYIHFAEMAKILFEVQHFAYSLQAQTRPNRKIYCIDNGLRNAVSFRFTEDEGKLAENLVFIELLRSGKSPFYWKKKKEVDFVVKSPENLLTAFNVSYTDSIPERECEGLHEFKGEFGDRVKEMIILTKDTEQVNEGIIFMPLWKWLLSDK
jgi:predicted AAA+ superfamily ATPase